MNNGKSPGTSGFQAEFFLNSFGMTLVLSLYGPLPAVLERMNSPHPKG